jgi:hypothetical protein
MNCPNCDQPIEPGATFCGNCGQSLVATASQPVQPVQSAQPVQAAPLVSPIQGQTPVQASYTAPATPIQAVPSPPPAAPPLPIQSMQPIAIGYANAQAVQAASPAAQQSFNPAVALPYAAMAVPARSGETLAILAVLSGVIALPGALWPILGLVLGIASVVMGSLSLKTLKHKLGLVGMIIGIIAIVCSLGLWALNAANANKQHASTGQPSGAPVATTTTSTGAQSVSTPCYDTTFPAALSVTGSTSTCTLTAKTNTEGYAVNVATNNSITATTFANIAKQSIETTAKSIGINLTSEQNGLFSGSPAFIVQGTYAANNQKTIIAAIYHPSTHGENMYFIEHDVLSGAVDLNAIESDWKWN